MKLIGQFENPAPGRMEKGAILVTKHYGLKRTGHVTSWREDLNYAKLIGCQAVREGLPWTEFWQDERKFDFSWARHVLSYCKNIGLDVVWPLIHAAHDFPNDWMARIFGMHALLSPKLPAYGAEYARRFLGEFAGEISGIIPWVEPQMSKYHCAIKGDWNPHLQNETAAEYISQNMLACFNAIAEVVREYKLPVIGQFFINELENAIKSDCDEYWMDYYTHAAGVETSLLDYWTTWAAALRKKTPSAPITMALGEFGIPESYDWPSRALIPRSEPAGKCVNRLLDVDSLRKVLPAMQGICRESSITFDSVGVYVLGNMWEDEFQRDKTGEPCDRNGLFDLVWNPVMQRQDRHIVYPLIRSWQDLIAYA
jgi:hypothetical protein